MSGRAPKKLGNLLAPKFNENTIREITENYQNHPQASLRCLGVIFDFSEATAEDTNESTQSLNPNKATGPDRIPLKKIKTGASVIDYHLAYIINKDLKQNKFSENAMTALPRPIHKKHDRHKIKNNKRVCLLNGFSKIYEWFLDDSLFNFLDRILSKFISAYRKSYSSNHVFLKLMEEWKKYLDDKNIVAVLMDMSKVFDCIPHDLLVE